MRCRPLFVRMAAFLQCKTTFVMFFWFVGFNWTPLVLCQIGYLGWIPRWDRTHYTVHWRNFRTAWWAYLSGPEDTRCELPTVLECTVVTNANFQVPSVMKGCWSTKGANIVARLLPLWTSSDLQPRGCRLLKQAKRTILIIVADASSISNNDCVSSLTSCLSFWVNSTAAEGNVYFSWWCLLVRRLLSFMLMWTVFIASDVF